MAISHVWTTLKLGQIMSSMRRESRYKLLHFAFFPLLLRNTHLYVPAIIAFTRFCSPVILVYIVEVDCPQQSGVVLPQLLNYFMGFVLQHLPKGLHFINVHGRAKRQNLPLPLSYKCIICYTHGLRMDLPEELLNGVI